MIKLTELYRKVGVLHKNWK